MSLQKLRNTILSHLKPLKSKSPLIAELREKTEISKLNSSLDSMLETLDENTERSLSLDEVKLGLSETSREYKNRAADFKKPRITQEDSKKGWEWAEPTFAALLLPAAATCFKLIGFSMMGAGVAVGVSLLAASSVAVGASWLHSRFGESREQRLEKSVDCEQLSNKANQMHHDLGNWAKKLNQSL